MRMPLTQRFTIWLAILFVLAPASFAQQAPATGNLWWKRAVIYEIYPRSFGDTDADGIGDLNGITAHLDYVKGLGLDAIWIAPMYPSPQVDFGYDISNYEGIDPQFGTMADFDRLMGEAGKRDIRVIIDLVLNHTSDQHPWFVESRGSRDNPKADWYVWRDPKPGGGPPNNWVSIFGHSAWEWEPKRGQYYYHAFYRQQPDLNWRNPEVRKAMYDVMRFWMNKGVSGFRLDAITTLFEDPRLRDEPAARPGKTAFGDPILTRQYTDNLPEVHDVLRELRKVTDEFPGRVLIGETYLPNVHELLKMYGTKNDELQLPMDLQVGFGTRLSAGALRPKLVDAETGLNGNVPLLVFDNHDNRRSWDRFGDGVHNVAIAKLIATLLLTPRDAALVYYGEELGMPNNDPKRKEDVRDPIGITGWPKNKGRDGERTPMQWNAGPGAGFSTAPKTWLPIPPDFKQTNVAVEEKAPQSLLNFYRALMRLRKENAALREGDFTVTNAADPNVLSYLRRAPDGTTVAVVLNCSANPQTFSLDAASGTATTLISSFGGTGDTVSLKALPLPAYGSWVGQVK